MTEQNQKSNDYSYTRYIQEYGSLTVGKIVTNFSSLEDSLFLDIVENMRFQFESLGFESEGHLLRHSDKHYEIIVSFVYSGRTLHIKLKDYDNPQKYNAVNKDTSQFGRIKNLIIELPEYLRVDINELSDVLAKQIKDAYSALETSFIHTFSEFQHSIFKRLYSILDGQLMSAGKERLIGSVWLVLFNEDIGHYCFDDQMLRQAIEHFKVRQDEDISPLEFSIWITTNPLPFKQTLSFEALKDDCIMSHKWSKAKYISAAHDFWKANKTLIPSDSYTVNPIFKKGEYSLTAAYAAEDEKDLNPEIKAIKPILQQQFVENVKKSSVWMKLLDQITTEPKHPVITAVKDVAVQFGAEVTARILKP